MALSMVLVPIAALALLGTALLVGSGDRTPVQQGCLPDVPRTQHQAGGSVMAQAGTAVVMPLPVGTFTVSSPFGPRDGGMHEGVDLAAAAGTPILAVTSGIVVAAGPAQGFGNWIVIDSQIDGSLLSTVYGHMFDDGLVVDGVKTSVGQQVRAGQQIGAVGSAGEASGPHLHFEVVPGGRLAGGQQIDPIPWLTQHGVAVDSSDESVQTAGSTTAAPVSEHPMSSRLRAGVAQAAGFVIGCQPVTAVGGSGLSLRAGSVPAAFEPWIRRAADTCVEVTAPLLAGQEEQESGFRTDAQSPAGAQGPAQFMPATWAHYGIDADGDGRVDITSIPDAVMSQARYDCDLAQIAKSGLAQGTLHGDLTELWLSMYNCGAAGTLSSGGVCPNSETLAYVKAIPALAAKYAVSLGASS